MGRLRGGAAHLAASVAAEWRMRKMSDKAGVAGRILTDQNRDTLIPLRTICTPKIAADRGVEIATKIGRLTKPTIRDSSHLPL